jgi:CHAT domain-containing protein/Tfp pilus assembly protein PilF
MVTSKVLPTMRSTWFANPLVALIVLSAGAWGQTGANAVAVELTPGLAAAKAGVLPGDILTAWRQGEARGEIRSPFELAMIETERGAAEVTLHGRRGQLDVQWVLPPAAWGLTSGSALEPYLAGAQLLKAGKYADAGLAWQRAAQDSLGQDSVWLIGLAANSFVRAQRWDEADRAFAAALMSDPTPVAARFKLEQSWGQSWFQRGQWDTARTHYEIALAEARRLSAPVSQAGVLLDLGRLFVERRQPKNAFPYLQESLSLLEQRAPESQDLANVLTTMGRAYYYSTDLNQAEKVFLRALQLAVKLNRSSLTIAALFHNLALVALGRDQQVAAEENFRKSLDIAAKADPGGVQWANSADSLGNLLRRRGNLAEAEEFQMNALAIRRRLQPGSLALASTLNNLGNLHSTQGNLLRAEAEYRESLELNEKLAPGSRELAGGWGNLGGLALTRGDLRLAQTFYDKSLALWKVLAPRSAYWAGTLINMSVVAQADGRLVDAELYLRQALSVTEWQAESPVAAAEAGRGLAQLYEKQNLFDKADTEFRKSLSVLTRELPGSLSVAGASFHLGRVSQQLGNWEEAERQYHAALSIREKLVPNTAELAESLHSMALVALHKAQPSQAEELFFRAIQTFENQADTVGGSETTGAGFRSDYAILYRDLIDLLVSRERYAQAFHTVERSRARALLDLMARRDLRFSGVPEDLDRLQRAAASEYNRLQQDIEKLSAGRDLDAVANVQARLLELSARRASLIDRARVSSPRFASLKYPAPLGLDGGRQALDHGALLLSFVVEPERTLLFVVRPPGTEPAVSLHRIPVKESDLRSLVQRFRAAIASGKPEDDARRLYDLLLQPAEASIDQSDRLLLCPSGPLHQLPFGALIGSDGRFLIARKPIHSTLSVTLYAQLRKSARPPESYPIQVAAFGGPRYNGSNDARGLESGSRLKPIPFSATEAKTIAGLFPNQSRLFLGVDATESNGKSIGGDVRILHFAVHGMLDEKNPLNSALAFSTPTAPNDADNGFLQAWELYQDVHWDADLVVLSSCESGLGQEFEGEGLMSLTRAIHYAGARSVLSSLWQIDDRRTEQLMTAFYRHLQKGTRKDEALQAAQLELLQSRGGAAPFYWAAFVLNGDWQ